MPHDLTVDEKIQHYQRNIERNLADSKRLEHCIKRLSDLPVTVKHLQNTGIGRTVNSLKKCDGEVGKLARDLVTKWKQMVIDEGNSEEEEEDEGIQEGLETYDSDEAEQAGYSLPNGSLEMAMNQENKMSFSSSSVNVSKDLVKLEAEDKESKRHDRKLIEKRKEEQDPKHKSSKDKSSKKHSKDKEENNKRKLNGSTDDVERKKKKTLETASSEEEMGKKEKEKNREESKKQRSESRSKHRDEKSERKRKEMSKSRNHSSSNDKDFEKKMKKNEEAKLKDKSKHCKDEKKKEKSKIDGGDGIDCNSGTSFAEALGMCTKPSAVRKRNSVTSQISPKVVKIEPRSSASSSSDQQTSSTSSLNMLSSLLPLAKLDLLNVDLTSTLPEISPHYKPLPSIQVNSLHRRQEEDRLLSEVIYLRPQRTKVFSGNKTGYTTVPSLGDLCIRILIENIDALEYTGGVPYFIIKPVLERANPDQLFALEHHNPYLINDTDELWQHHCNMKFRNEKREEMESWREMYLRCLEERELKLQKLTANIKQNHIEKTQPQRMTILADVDRLAKPPRNILRKQAKYGTAKDLPTASSDLKKKLIGASNIIVPSPAMARMRSNLPSVVKKTKAPLMAKALQLIKSRYKR